MVLTLAAVGRDKPREKVKGVKGAESLGGEGRREGGRGRGIGLGLCSREEIGWLVSNPRKLQKRYRGVSDSSLYF